MMKLYEINPEKARRKLKAFMNVAKAGAFTGAQVAAGIMTTKAVEKGLAMAISKGVVKFGADGLGKAGGAPVAILMTIFEVGGEVVRQYNADKQRAAAGGGVGARDKV